MQITNREILDSIGVVQDLQSRELPGKFVYALTKNTRTLQSALDDFQKARTEIINKHAEMEDGEVKRGDDNLVVFPSDEAKDQSAEELNDVIMETVEVDIHQVGPEAIPDGLTTAMVSKIGFMLK